MKDKDILIKLIDGLGMKSINSFSKEIGYSSPSAIYLVMSGDRNITEHMIRQIKQRFPSVNEVFLRGRSEEMFEKEQVVENVEDYTLNDMPTIMLKLLKEQRKTNELLVKLLGK